MRKRTGLVCAFADRQITCPATGGPCIIGVSVRLKPRRIEQMPLGEQEPPETAEADSDG